MTVLPRGISGVLLFTLTAPLDEIVQWKPLPTFGRWPWFGVA